MNKATPTDEPHSHWDRLCELYSAALHLPAASREQFLAGACGPDDAIKQEVLSLLAVGPGSPGFLEISPKMPEPIAAVEETPRLSPGQTLAARFRIDRFLGRGGMGEVYQAADVELGEDVAIKLLKHDLAPDPMFLRRFRREIRLARRVTHPNVCRVFDLARDDSGDTPLHFFVMELLEGETLATRLQRDGPIVDDDSALSLARQIAGGLAAAHAAGIVHRDLKPANVMLAPGAAEPRAVIMDFGLASLARIESTSSTTTTSMVLGTPGYVAPEQWYRGPVSAATDIYAFGVVLREMRTGIPAREHATLPDAWRQTVERCTQLDPRARFASVDDVVRRLAPQSGLRGWTRRHAVSLAAAGGVTAAVSLSAGFLRLKYWKPKVVPGASLLLTEVANLTGDSQFDGITELLRTQLAQSAWLNVVEPERLRDALKQMNQPSETRLPAEVAREAGWRLQSVLVAFGTLARVGPDYGLSIQLEIRGDQPKMPAHRELRTFPAQGRTELMQAVRAASLWMRDTVGESAASLAHLDRLPEDATTPDWEALSYFARAEQLARAGETQDALLMLDSALDRDPQFTLAAMRKGDLLISLHRDGEGLAQWRHAFDLFGKRRVTRREELRVRGMYAFDAGDQDAADRSFAQWAMEYPHDMRGLFYRTVPLLMAGRAEEAIRNLNRVLELDPAYASAYAQLVNCHLALGDFGKAAAAIAGLRRLGEVERPMYKQGVLNCCRGDLEAAAASFADLGKVAKEPWSVRSPLFQAMLLAEAATDGAAMRLLERAPSAVTSASDTDRAYCLLALAFLRTRTGDPQAVPELVKQALELQAGPINLGHAGAILARAGHTERAEAVRATCVPMLEFPKYKAVAYRLAGEVALARGDAPGAVAEFQKASAIEPRLAYREYLARGLRLSGRIAEADELDLKIARQPWLPWLDPMSEMPGAWGDAVRRQGDPGLSGVRKALTQFQLTHKGSQ